MDKKNVVYIISYITKSQVFEWTIDLLDTSKFNYSFILLHREETPFELFLKGKGFETSRINYNGKKDVLRAVATVYKTLKKRKADIVHAHMFDASFVGLLAARLKDVKTRIYTRHYSTLHHEYHPHAVMYDRIINSLSTHIIAVSGTVKKVLVEMENVKQQKISIVHHGFKLSEFENISPERIKGLRDKYKIPAGVPVIGIVSRYIHWKGIQNTIEAFRMFLEQYPDACLVLANAKGPYKKEIQEHLSKLPSKNYIEIPFETDILGLFKLFNVFVHVPVDPYSEAFGQVYIESMLSKVPGIVTLSGIANEIIKDHENALVVEYNDNKDIYERLLELYKSSELQKKLTVNAYDMAVKMFPVEVMTEVEKLY